ncbi:MAG: hypothetical protein Q9175_004131, partial [Cornicularia normoerica]
MSAKTVVDISSDEEENAAKSITRTKSTGKQPSGSTSLAIKTPFRALPTADTPDFTAPATAHRPGGPTNLEPRSQSADTSPSQAKQEAPKDRAPSAPQSATIIKTPSTSPLPPTVDDDPPKPTPLDINEFRHLVSAGS